MLESEITDEDGRTLHHLVIVGHGDGTRDQPAWSIIHHYVEDESDDEPGGNFSTADRVAGLEHIGRHSAMLDDNEAIRIVPRGRK